MQKNRIHAIETWQSPKNKQYYFRAKSRNGKTIFPSEAYTTKRMRDHTVKLINSSLVSLVKVIEVLPAPVKKAVAGKKVSPKA